MHLYVIHLSRDRKEKLFKAAVKRFNIVCFFHKAEDLFGVFDHGICNGLHGNGIFLFDLFLCCRYNCPEKTADISIFYAVKHILFLCIVIRHVCINSGLINEPLFDPGVIYLVPQLYRKHFSERCCSDPSGFAFDLTVWHLCHLEKHIPVFRRINFQEVCTSHTQLLSSDGRETYKVSTLMKASF